EPHGAQIGERAHGCVVAQLDAKLRRPPLEYSKQLPAGQPAEAVATGRQGTTAEVDIDVVPVGETACYVVVGRSIGAAEVLEGLIAEDYAPAIRVVRAVTLQH